MASELRFSPPPRRLPTSLVVANLFNGFAQTAWAFLGFGTMFFWGFAMNADVSFVSFRGPLAEAAGEVLRVEETSFSEGRQSRAATIYANHYRYDVADRPLAGVSYSVGRRAEPGQRVVVEYTEADPARSRIAGMRRAPFGPWALAIGVFALAGLVMLAFASAIGWRRARLLRTGHLVMATLKHKRPTAAKVDRRVVHELTFEFRGRDGRPHEVKVRTSAPERLEDERQEPLLYDPARPSRASLLDEAASRPRFGTTGELLGSPRPMLRLLLPALVMAVNGWLLLRHLT